MIDAAPPPRAAAEIRWTSRAYLLVGAGGGLIALAVALGNPVPLFAGLPLLLAPLLAGSQLPRGLSRVDLDWRAEGIGAEVKVRGRLHGDFGRSAGDVTLRLPGPTGVRELAPPRIYREPEAIRFEMDWHLPEPSVRPVPPPIVVWRDPLGLAERTLAGNRPPLLVDRSPSWPRHSGAIRLQRTTPLPGEIRSRVLGASGEFFGLRAAAPNEPPRRINWRASAREGRLLANDYQLERTGDLVIVLDRRPTGWGPELDQRLIGVARAAAYGIAESVFRGKVRFGFAAFGEFLEALPLSSGRIHRLRVLRAIAAARRTEYVGPGERCALGLSRFYRPGVTTIVISSWSGDPSLNLVPYIQRQGFPVVLLSPSPLPMRTGWGALPAAEELLASRLEQLERRAYLADLWSHGPVVDWTDYWSLEPLARTLQRPVLRRAA